jgi:transcriptional regulator of acetoin/glycerol metabolism
MRPGDGPRLAAFTWPGNIRQLQNVIEHSAILCDDGMLRVPPALVVEKQPGVRSTFRLDTTLHHNEQELIEQALEETAGRVSGPSGAAARLACPPRRSSRRSDGSRSTSSDTT